MKMVLSQNQHVVTGKLMVTVACPDAEIARRIGRVLVEKRLAACVHIGPQMESIYRWKGTVETANETLLVIKTAQAKWKALVAEVGGLHPYEVPEILAVPIELGLEAYLGWMDEELTPAAES